MSRNKTRLLRIASGLCRDCGKGPPVPSKNICELCADKRYLRNQARKESLYLESKCARCGYVSEDNKTLCRACMLKQIGEMRLRRKANKELVVDYLGGKCGQCGENDIVCLTIDHINNNGNVECRSETTGKRIISPQWYAQLAARIKTKQPLFGLQLLCFNCHAKKDLQPWWIKDD